MRRLRPRPLAWWLLAACVAVAPAMAQQDVQEAPPSDDLIAPPPPPEPAIVDEDDLPPAPLYADTLEAREAPADVLQRFRDDPTYLYDSPEAERPSGWDRFLSWLYRKLFSPLARGATSDSGEVIVIVLAIFILGWVITRLLRADAGPLFGKKDLAPEALTGPLLDVDDIREVDVSTLLDRALIREDYREAVRFRYVLALQALATRGIIEWRRDKTNRDYVREARAASGAVAEPFADVTRAFDFVWYGERAVDRARYARLGDLFDRFDAALTAPPVAA
ncbi:MAG: DUF4129 domain-containing protein [Bacteroidota bacterium]